MIKEFYHNHWDQLDFLLKFVTFFSFIPKMTNFQNIEFYLTQFYKVSKTTKPKTF